MERDCRAIDPRNSRVSALVFSLIAIIARLLRGQRVIRLFGRLLARILDERPRRPGRDIGTQTDSEEAEGPEEVQVRYLQPQSALGLAVRRNVSSSSSSSGSGLGLALDSGVNDATVTRWERTLRANQLARSREFLHHFRSDAQNSAVFRPCVLHQQHIATRRALAAAADLVQTSGDEADDGQEDRDGDADDAPQLVQDDPGRRLVALVTDSAADWSQPTGHSTGFVTQQR